MRKSWMIGGCMLAAGVLSIPSCEWMRSDTSSPASQPATTPTTSTPEQTPAEDSAGIAIEDITEGDGPSVRPDSLVVVRMTGTLDDGTLFFESPQPQGPWPVEGLVEGLARGIIGMRPGATRRITVPPDLAYADREILDDAGKVLIPPGSTLIFEVELIEVRGESAGTDSQSEQSAPEQRDGDDS